MNESSFGLPARMAAGHSLIALLAAAACVAAAAGAGGLFQIVLTTITAAAAAGSYFWCRGAAGQLGRLVDSLGVTIAQISAAGEQVASASQSLAQGATEQAATLEETSASGQEISALALANTDHSQNAASLVGQAETSTNEALQKLEQMVMAMVEINDASKQVAKITKVIDEIAFQTNILALNAAVEAARAGESGLGFAVVADEVRNLSRRAADAARDIASLIEQSMTRVDQGTAKLDEVTMGVGAIVDNASKARALVDEVHQGSAEQAKGLQRVSQALAQIEQVTQQAAANAEEGAAAAEELAGQTGHLNEALGQIRSLVGLEPVRA